MLGSIMGDRDNRPTVPNLSLRGQKVQTASALTALVAAIPAIIMAWQSGDDADSARRDAREQARDVSSQGYDRDSRLLRRTKRALELQANDIDACFDQLDEMSEALEELYQHVQDENLHKHVRKSSRSPRPLIDALPTLPNWKRVPRHTETRSKAEQLPASLEDL